ncbi:peptidylprolyl isomerase [Calidifontimicrobium sp. SYSU G02091]|uniref:peptidylprolyl isomerase n=1 Tax=Calidifontimicrobium sp. SYSU G02091 TaxID=2926421 RepID=UPI001F539B99|nr:peptidylprolyl isomerase [Calidifontimicrobium sp. SYSU G02091]MCI1191430.1 peptidylprolyl isomerase [Calidifontimicrobium sp. SYSU G02091]
MNAPAMLLAPRPSVNGVPLASDDEALDAAALRQRASVELLRQAAIAAGLLAADDPAPVRGATSEAATAAIEALLDRELVRPEPDDEACRRYHAANAARFARGERVRLRHVLFAVTPGVDVGALRRRAEALLIDLRARAPGEADRFAAAAAQWSNCPSAQAGGDLGWLGAEDCAPEFAREVFGHPEVGVLPRLVHSRFGLHVVEVLERRAGALPPYEAVRGAVRRTLEAQAFVTALRQYLQRLAGAADVRGVDLDATASPLVQ